MDRVAERLALEDAEPNLNLIQPACARGCEVESNVRMRRQPVVVFPDEPTLRREVDANVCERNAKACPVKWKFTAQDARRKLARLYPSVSQ